MSWSPWRKSSRSGQGSNCVEVAWHSTGQSLTTGVRDSKNQEGPMLVVSADAFTSFVNATRAEER